MTYVSILDQILDEPAPANYGLHKSASSSEEVDPLEILLRDVSKAGNSSPSDWRGKSASSIGGIGLLAEAAQRVAGNKEAHNIEKTRLSALEVKAKISELLNMGFTPDHVASEMDKLSELCVFDKQMSSDTLKDMAGVVGYAFREPSSPGSTCADTYEKSKASGGRVAALSIRRIAACGSCKKCSGGGSHCSLYKLPIVASKHDLEEVLNTRMASLGKKASKSTLVDLHNGVQKSSHLAPSNHDMGPVGGFSSIRHAEEKVVTASQVAQMTSSTDFFSVYNNLLPTYGKVATKRAMGQWINGLKTSSAKVDINLVDCKFLAGKLSSCNAITGTNKCAECTKRGGMHCGLTGGTLVSFPGMASLKSSKKAHAGAKEGHQVLAEWQLESSDHMNAAQGDIDVSGFKFDDIQTHGPMDLE